MKRNILIVVIAVMIAWAPYYFGAWDATKPIAGRKARFIDDDVRTNNAGIEAALDQDHDFTTGGTLTGKHETVILMVQSTPGATIPAASEGALYTKDVSEKAELHFEDEDDKEIQISSGGSILSASLDSKDEDDMASDSATHTATQQSIKAYVDSGTATLTNKTLTSAVLNTAVSGTAVLDEDNMASDSATQVATQQSIKKYVDDQVAAATPDDDAFGSWASKTKDTSYEAASDGLVIVFATATSGSWWNLDGYTDGNNPPTTKRGKVKNYSDRLGGFTMPVKKGDFWKIVPDAAVTTLDIYWLPIGG